MTAKLLLGTPAASRVASRLSVCMSSRPTFHAPTLPETRPPPRIGMGRPVGEMPIARLKKRSTSPGLPTAKKPAFSRKNGRFSGKNRLNRSRFTCWSSTSTCAKSVLTVASSVRLGVRLYLRSPPTSPSQLVFAGFSPLVTTLPSTYGISFRLRNTGTAMSSTLPASEARVIENCRGIGAQYERSLRRRMLRWKFTPHTCVRPAG
jgi:hypothetical protein